MSAWTLSLVSTKLGIVNIDVKGISWELSLVYLKYLDVIIDVILNQN